NPLNDFAIISLISATISFFIANFIYFRNPKNSLNRTITIFSVLVSFMALCEFAYRLAESSDSAFIWLKLSALWPFIPAVLLHTAFIFTQRSYILRSKLTYVLIYGPALIFVILGIATNFFIGPPIHEYWGWIYSIPLDESIYDLFAIWTVLVSFISSWMVFLYAFQSETGQKRQSVYISFGIFMPLILGLITDFILRSFSIEIPELTQTFLSIGLVFIAYGVWRYDFPILTPSQAAEKIISTMPNLLILADHKGNITKVNSSLTSVLGYDENDLIGKPFYEIFASKQKIDLKEIIQDGKQFNIESVICSIDHQKIDVFLNISPILDILKLTTGFVIIGTDLTEIKRASQKIIESEFKFRSVVEQISDGISLAVAPGIIIDWNSSMEEITGIKKEDFNDKFIHEIIHDLIPLPLNEMAVGMDDDGHMMRPLNYYKNEFENAFKDKILPDSLKINETKIIRFDGSSRDVMINNFFVEKCTPHILCTVVQDITDQKESENFLKASLEEKEILLREIHHRVKNNLQIISSLLNLQKRYVNDKQALNLFQESQNRVKSMSMIHESLYQATDLGHIDFSVYISKLSIELMSSYGVNTNQISLKREVEEVVLDINTAIPCGLIINELMTNCIKYAFPEGRKGTITIKFFLEDEQYVLEVSDDGIGLPEDIDFKKMKSLGIRLVNSLVGQLDGTIELDTSSGTKFIIKFKELEYDPRI
ncbi:MAG: histidine kinase dimerization/phosphoacceptor domain -containing protein, partial [Methanobacteriaceae archaeon]|nr:histidine kinase dimerization/phosphoacceptor domain -containing protein [Methanobacteriaceae archaeon]